MGIDKVEEGDLTAIVELLLRGEFFVAMTCCLRRSSSTRTYVNLFLRLVRLSSEFTGIFHRGRGVCCHLARRGLWS